MSTKTRDLNSLPYLPRSGDKKSGDWIVKSSSFLIVGFVLFILIFGTTIVLSFRHFEEAKENALASDKITANLLADIIMEHNNATVGILQSYAHRPLFVNAVKSKDVTSVHRHLSDLKKNAEIDLTFVTDGRGVLWANLPVFPEAIGKDLSSRDWYQGTSALWKPYISKVFKLIVGNKPLAAAVCVPIIDEKERVIGILATSQRLSFIDDIVQRMPLTPHTRVTVIDRAGQIIYSNIFSYRENITVHPFFPSIETALKKKQQQIEINNPQGNREKINLFVVPVGITGWSIIAGRTQSDIFRSEFKRFVELWVASLLLFLLCISLLVYLRKVSLFRKTEELLQVEKKLRQIEERYTLTIAAVNDGIWDWHVPSGNAFFSVLYYEILGYKDREFPATYDSWRILVHPEDIERVEGALQKSIESGKGFAIDLRMRQKTGEWLWVSTRGKTVEKDSENKALRMIGTLTDITERKQAETDKEKLEAQNRQLQKSESMGRMAAAIAHHFNNQLSGVIGNLELTIGELPKGATTTNRLTKAMQAAWKAADMSGLMLTYLGQTHNERESLDLSYSCHKILPLLKEAIPANTTMETNFPSPGPIIMGNAGEIQQILTNLITNAWESIGNNKATISLNVKTVSPAEIPTKNRFPIDWQQQDKAYACLEATDTGSGIKSKEIETLFDPFFSTKFTGRGMGLAVVLGLVNSYKGVITVESKPGKGSTFRLFFPVSEETLRQPQTPESDSDVTISSSSPKKMEESSTVLVVEDEEMLRNMVAAMLESFSFTVLKAKDGIEALEVFGKHQSEIKFVLTDLTMPRMNGWETLTELRKLQPNIPVILASGYDLAHVMEGDHPELPQAFLAKPYNLKALRDAVRQATEKIKG